MAPSKQVNDALGAVGGKWVKHALKLAVKALYHMFNLGGGVLLASMMTPQLYKLYKTQRANDISLAFLFLYLIGTLLLFIYLYFEGAIVAWICLAVEMGLLVLVIAMKIYLDFWGPYGRRAMREKGAAELQQAAGQPNLSSSYGCEYCKDSSRKTIGDGQLASEAERGAIAEAAAAAAHSMAEGVRQRSQHA